MNSPLVRLISPWILPNTLTKGVLSLAFPTPSHGSTSNVEHSQHSEFDDYRITSCTDVSKPQ